MLSHASFTNRLLHFCLLVAALVAAPRSVQSGQPSGWPDQERVGPYVFHADFKLSNIRVLVRELVQLEQDLSNLLQIGSPQEPVYIYLFQERRTFQDYISKHFPKIPIRQALYVKNGGPGMIFAHLSDELLIDLRHEATHALLHANLKMVPLWLDEGIAEYFEADPAKRFRGDRHLSAAKWRNRFSGLPKLEDLEKISDLSRMRKGEYLSAWSWVHFLLHGNKEARAEFMLFLTDIKKLNPPGQLSHRLRLKIPDLDRKQRSHLGSWPTRSAGSKVPLLKR